MDLLVALAVFCLVTLFTPGPNNLMLMTSGLVASLYPIFADGLLGSAQ